MSKKLYKVLHLLVVVLSGKVVSALFEKLWQAATRSSSSPPEATDLRSGWPEILLASAAYGAILGVAKAAGDRGGAAGVRKLTGEWPVEEADGNPTK